MKLDRTISLILIIILTIAVIATIYITVTPNPGEKFTEFYLLGPDGKAGDYPTNLTTNDVGSLIIGIANHEQAITTYNLVVKLNNNILLNQNIVINNNETKQIPFSFTAPTGNNQKLDFLLYKLPSNNTPYREVYLIVNVS